MPAGTIKAQPLDLKSLLKMRKQLENRLRAGHKKDVSQTGQMQGLYHQCEEAIHDAEVEKRIAGAPSSEE